MQSLRVFSLDDRPPSAKLSFVITALLCKMSASCLSWHQYVSLQLFDELLIILEHGHRNRMGCTLCRPLKWPWQSISVSESFKYSSVIALPRKGSLSKQGDRHLASLCNDHTAYLCDNQKLNRNREQGSASTFRWLSHCCFRSVDLCGHYAVYFLSLCSLR